MKTYYNSVKLITFAGLLFLINICSQAQTVATVDSVERTYQACLDKGVGMLGCSRTFYTQMDNLLNMAYRHLRQKYSPAQKEQLKQEQLGWLRKRDVYFSSVNKEQEEEGLGAADREMIKLDKKAQYVQDRVIELIKKAQK